MPPAPSRPKFPDLENCCGFENQMSPKFFWDMEGHRSPFLVKKSLFFSKTHILEKIDGKSQ